MRISDREDRCRARDQASRSDLVADAPGQSGNARYDAEQRERPNPGDARAFLDTPKVEAALNSDQQPAGERGAERQRVRIPFLVQRRPSIGGVCVALRERVKRLVPDAGIEPATFGLQNRCSTS